jgi:ATP-binding cassette, subfamily B, bacterial
MTTSSTKTLSTARLIWRLLRYMPWLFLANLVLWGLVHTLPILFGLLTKAIFDALSGEAPAGLDVWSVIALLAVFNLARMGTFSLGFWSWTTYWLTMEALLRRNLLDWLMRAPGFRSLPDSPGEAVSRFRDDVGEVVENLENWVDFGGLFLFAVIAILLMLRIDSVITLTVSLPLVGMVALVSALSPKIRQYRKRSREATGRVTDFIGETFAAVQAVKVAGAETPMVNRLKSLGETRRHAALKDSLLTELLRSTNANMVNLGTGMILLLAAQAMRAGTFTVGDFALFIAWLPRLSSTMAFFGDMIAQHRRTAVSFERMHRLLSDAPAEKIVEHAPLLLKGELPEVPRPQGGERLDILTVRNLSYRYPGSHSGIENVSLKLKRGSFTVITGRIGAGKTTLLKVLLGLLPRDGGEIKWNGKLVDDPASFFTPPRSAYTAQVPRLFSDTLKDNVLMGREASEEELWGALDLAVMTPDVAALEKGLDTVVGARGVKLSGGQIQRASAARMFVKGAELLVFDDLSSALDVETERLLWKRLFERRQATCLVVSHRRAALQRADHILVLKDGRVEAEGKLRELLERSLEMQRLWEGDV